MRSTAIRLAAAFAAALITVAGAPAALLPSALQATAAAAPLGLFATDLTFVVDGVTPTVVTRDSPDLLEVSGTVTNTADVPVSDLIVRFQRGDALTSEQAVNQNIADPGQPDAVIAGDWQSFGTEGATFAAGESRPFRVGTTITGDAAQGLGITRPGVYPVMANINGTRDVDGVPSSVRLGELHVLVTVTSVADRAPGTDPAPNPQPSPEPSTAAAVPLGIAWPISSIPHRTIGGAFSSEALAGEISQGGALAANLDALQQSGLPAANVVFVIDPMLLDELDTMARGYRVVAPGSAPTPLDPATGTSVETPPTAVESEPSTSASAAPSSPASAATTAVTTATTVPVAEAGTVAGTHAAAATAFLDRLRGAFESSQVVVLPYSDPDTVQLTASGQGSLLRTLRTKGTEIAARVLQRTDLVTDVALPPGAVLDAATVDVYQRVGFRSLLVSRRGISGTPQSGGIGRIAGATTTLPSFVGDQTLQPLISQVLDPRAGVPGAGALNSAVAILAVRHTAGTELPVLQLPGTTVDVGGLGQLGSAVIALSGDGVTTGVDVRTITKGASAVANLGVALPTDAALLSQGYVDRLVAARATIARTATVIDPDPDRSGAGDTVIRTLLDGVDGLFSASLRSTTTPGDAVLSTAESSLTRIQDAVSIRTGAGSYTLASADSPLVLTLQNQLPFPVTVRLTVISGVSAGLQLELPPSIRLNGKQSRQITIPSSVSRAGTFSVTVQLANPGSASTSRPWGEGQKIEIRSNAYGALTLILMISAGGVLFLMVGLRLVQRVRDRGKAPAPATPTDSIAAMAEEAAQGTEDATGSADPGAPRTTEPQESVR